MSDFYDTLKEIKGLDHKVIDELNKGFDKISKRIRDKILKTRGSRR